MTRALLTPARVRRILDGAMTEQDAALALQRHRVRYSFSTTGGALHIRIPARRGHITVTRTASRTAPLRVSTAVPAGYPFPLPAWPWDD